MDRRWVRTALVATAVWGLIGLVWAITSPLFSVPDEPAHMLRAASVASGQLVGDRQVHEEVEPRPVVAVVHVVDVPAGLAAIGNAHDCYAPFRGTADCAAPLVPTDGVASAATTAGSYQPLFYALTGAPVHVTSPAQAVYLGRALHVLWGALLLGTATAVAREVGGRRLLVAQLVAMTPFVPYLLGSINPSGVEIAAAAALWIGVPALLLQPDRTRHAVLVAAAALSLAWSRPLSPLIAVGIVVAAGLVVGGRAAPVLRRSRAAKVAAVAVALSVVSAAAWVVLAGALDSFIAYPEADLTRGDLVRMSNDLAGGRVLDLVGVLGWLDTPLPRWLQAVWLASWVGLLVAAWRVATPWRRALLVLLVIATLAAPFLADVVRGAEMGLVWQSRYTLPIAIGIPLIAGWVWARPDERTVPAPAGAVERAATAAVVVVVAGGHLYTHLLSMSRYSTGWGSSVWRYVISPGWQAPLPDLPLLLLMLVAVAGLIAVHVWPAPTRDQPALAPLPVATDGPPDEQ